MIVPWILAGAVSTGLALTLSGVSFGQLAGATKCSGVLFLTHVFLQVLIVGRAQVSAFPSSTRMPMRFSTAALQ
ncbi:hypothetical protein [Luteitalea pratensis]|uniref:hypothetical protein n=1 Tax=Luteitalea pratensis TaxID=1855912 RepID=UPI000D72BC15|nr:hypothetical protein [Luteitalea pratensis]